MSWYKCTFRPRRRSLTNDLPDHRPWFIKIVEADTRVIAQEKAEQMRKADGFTVWVPYCWLIEKIKDDATTIHPA